MKIPQVIEFIRDHEQDYDRLDRRCDALTLSESRIGAYGEPGAKPDVA